MSSSPLSMSGSSPTARALWDWAVTAGDLQLAEEKLKALGFDPGPVDGIFTPQTAEAVRQYQRRYGFVVNGLLDRLTREELIPGLDGPIDDNM